MDVWVFSHRNATKFGISSFVMYRGTIGREGGRERPDSERPDSERYRLPDRV